MSRKPEIKEVPEGMDDGEVVELTKSDDGGVTEVVDGGEESESEGAELELVQNDVLGSVKPTRLSRKKNLRSKDLDSSVLEQERASKQNVEDEWERKTGRIWNRWVVLSGLLVLMLIAGGVVWAVSQLDSGSAKGDEADEQLQRQLLHDQKARRSASELVADIEKACKTYVEAESVEEILSLVRSPERVEPLIRAYYKDHVLKKETLKSIRSRIPVELEHRVFWLISYRTKESTEPSQLLVEQTEDGVKVDWESKVVYQPTNWEKFVRERVSEPSVFRVYLEVVESMAFYGYEFSDYKKYRCFRITLKGREDYLWGYSELGSDLDKRLMAMSEDRAQYMTDGEGAKIPAIIKIQFPKDSMSDKCVILEELLSRSWVMFE